MSRRFFERTAAIAALALIAATAPPKSTSHAAPADEYFGRLKMSAMQVRLKIDELGRKYHARTVSDSSILHDGAFLEEALAAWHARYPGDPWLPPTMLHLEEVYMAVQDPVARNRATQWLRELVRDYPRTREGIAARARLHAGLPPLHAETPVKQPSATPEAAASATAAPAMAAPSPASSPSPAPAMATTAPAPRPSPTGRP